MSSGDEIVGRPLRLPYRAHCKEELFSLFGVPRLRGSEGDQPPEAELQAKPRFRPEERLPYNRR